MQGRDAATVVAVAALAILFLALLGGGMMGPWMMGWGYFGYGGLWWMWIATAIFWILVIGAVIWLVVWIFRRTAEAAAGPPGGRALDILRERYARGEITRDEYEQMRRDLEGR